MEQIFFTAIVNAAALMLTLLSTWKNRSMNRSRKIGFSILFASVALVVITEAITVYADGRSSDFRALNLISNYIGFIFTPLLPIICASVLSGYKRFKAPLSIYGIYLIFVIINAFNGLIFSVSADNAYTRGDAYWIFIVFYIIEILFLFFEIVYFNALYQASDLTYVAAMLAFLVLGTAIQIIYPDIYTTWSCITLFTIILHSYFNTVYMHTDALTKLLNHGCFLEKIRHVKLHTAFLIFDIDGFKNVNDTYGHPIGDECLRRVGRAIRSVFGSHGLCYRIGGDEFAVVLKCGLETAAVLESDFRSEIAIEQAEMPELPTVAVGYAFLDEKGGAEKVLAMADKSMYMDKHRDN